MTKDAQIAPNHPLAPKAANAQVAVILGHFTLHNFVRPEELTEHNQFCQTFWTELQPAGALQQAFAAEIIRAAWRLRCCGIAEASLANESLPDAMPGEATARAQVAIDRARAQAHNIMRQSTAELRRLQTERKTPPTTQAIKIEIPETPRNKDDFSANEPEINPEIEMETELEINPEIEPLPEQVDSLQATQSAAHSTPRPTPRSAQCPCGSREKYKRCCGRNAPAILQRAA